MAAGSVQLLDSGYRRDSGCREGFRARNMGDRAFLLVYCAINSTLLSWAIDLVIFVGCCCYGLGDQQSSGFN